MLNNIIKKDEILKQRKCYFEQLSPEEQTRYQALYDELGVERMDDLSEDKLNELLESLYSDLGAPARDPKPIFHSYYLFNISDSTSLDKWVKRIQSDPILKVFIGLKPEEKAPSIGTYYNFVDRFLAGIPESEKLGPKNKNSKKPKKPEQNQKAENPNPTHSTQQLKEGILSGESYTSEDAAVFNELLVKLGVEPSIECGLIPEDEITISGDGTCYEVAANPNGHKQKGLPDSLRCYSAPDADFGWDSSKKYYYYGFSAYLFTYYEPFLGKDLPMSLDLFPASEHDSTACLKSLSGLFDALPQLEIDKILLDSAHDNLATYELCLEMDIEPFIDINYRVNKPEDERGVSFTKLGIPVCELGREMKFDGHSQKRGDCKWKCPLSRTEHCPKQCCNNPSTHAFYTKTEKNPRFFTKTPRNSKKFKKTYNARSASERINKRILCDYNLEEYRFRSRKLILFCSTLACIDIHKQAQLEFA